MTITRIIIFLFSCQLILAGTVAGDYKRGVEEYNKGNYSQAYILLLPEAENGNTNAQYRIGYLLQNGLGVEKDVKKGLSWIRKAAEAGDFVAQGHLGNIYAEGNGIGKNIVEAYAWTKASNQNYEHKITAAQLEVIKSNMTPEELKKAKQLSKKYYEKYVKPFVK